MSVSGGLERVLKTGEGGRRGESSLESEEPDVDVDVLVAGEEGGA
jgi:hypothetical protein